MKTSLLFRLVVLFMLAEFACAGEQKPNILFILTDNQAASLLGAYGNPDIRTPNIDRLAAEGITFTRAYAVNGMCSPNPGNPDDRTDALAARHTQLAGR